MAIEGGEKTSKRSPKKLKKKNSGKSLDDSQINVESEKVGKKRRKGHAEPSEIPAKVRKSDSEVDSGAINRKRDRKKCKKKKKSATGKEGAAGDVHVHETKGQNKALRYLKAWDESQNGTPSGWKFEKCRQIWLLQNAYDSKKISDENFDTLLKYMCSIKGRMRDVAKGIHFLDSPFGF